MITTTTNRESRRVRPMRSSAAASGGRPIWASVLTALMLCAGGCSGEDPAPAPPATTDSDPANAAGDGNGYGYGGYGSYYGAGEIKFLDEATTNASPQAELSELVFVDVDGNEQSVSKLAGDKHLVLVITRGNTTPICPYCSTQVARLIGRYDEIAKRDAEVVAVYPIETGEDGAKLDAFLENSRNRLDDPGLPIPFPVVLDVELQAVDRLGIRKDLSKPATYIVDKEGRVRFAYVGANIADRPGVDAILAQLDQIARDDQPAESPEETAETL
ncbi:peroxiredoxin family protein [Maioricimonas rarisocia]|nr:redoxin domain-containing protein [Maioricimonas rarisocia]